MLAYYWELPNYAYLKYNIYPSYTPRKPRRIEENYRTCDETSTVPNRGSEQQLLGRVRISVAQRCEVYRVTTSNYVSSVRFREVTERPGTSRLRELCEVPVPPESYLNILYYFALFNVNIAYRSTCGKLVCELALEACG